MALGIQGTGPYGKIRSLEQDIKDYKYEISLVEQGIKKKPGKKYYQKLIEDKKDELRKIKDCIKNKNAQ